MNVVTATARPEHADAAERRPLGQVAWESETDRDIRFGDGRGALLRCIGCARPASGSNAQVTATGICPQHRCARPASGSNAQTERATTASNAQAITPAVAARDLGEQRAGTAPPHLRSPYVFAGISRLVAAARGQVSTSRSRTPEPRRGGP